MNVDKALANFCNSFELRKGGDTGRRRVEHRGVLQLELFSDSRMQVRGANIVSYPYYIEDEVFGGTLLRIR